MKIIPLTQGLVAKVDDFWFDRRSCLKWQAARDHARERYYAVHARRGHPNLIMHRVITNAPKGKMVDHINHDAIDNRECNLRICTNGQNQANQLPKKNCTSVYKGVSWAKATRKWYSYIRHKNQSISLGFFDDERDAATAYDNAAVSLRGEFALTNF